MIVITTPTGQIGRQVLSNLLDSGEELRVIARDRSKLPASIRDDLDVIEGSHGDAAVVDKAFAALKAPVRRVTAPHTPVPFAPSLEKLYIPDPERITAAVREVHGYAR